ncbi:Transposase [Parapedobacter luteus]|uniref:Transposase n=1 Tax=Parapedobacter luteus TaxID=623280 RepID=A0A1T5BHB3_9SPHI|nr:Transposase [Parapedobacter luteus]
MAITKQSIGIDISRLTFSACLCQRSEDGRLTFSATGIFDNDTKGFNQFLRWSKTVVSTGPELVFLMEATGVYYENLVRHLHKNKKTVHVVLPNTSKHYFSSLNIKTKTDFLATWLKYFASFGRMFHLSRVPRYCWNLVSFPIFDKYRGCSDENGSFRSKCSIRFCTMCHEWARKSFSVP